MDPDEECERVCEADAAKDECGQYLRTCGDCGFQWRSSHCIHDGVQNPCPECGWRLPGSKTPMQFLGFSVADVPKTVTRLPGTSVKDIRP